MPLAEPMPPSSSRHRLPDLFELSEYDFEELCEELVRSLDGVTRTAQKNRRGNPQFGVDVEGYSAAQKPFVVLSAKRERGPTKAKIGRWSNDFLKHLDGHWAAKGVERFILACADELRGDQVNGQITDDTKLFAEHAIAYEAWDRKEIVRLLRTRRIWSRTTFIRPGSSGFVESALPPRLPRSRARAASSTGTFPAPSRTCRSLQPSPSGWPRGQGANSRWRWTSHVGGRAAALDAFLGRIRTDAVQWDALPDGDKARILRLAAARALAYNDRSSARRHADDAAAFHEPEDRALEALLLRSEERSEEALRLLADPVNEAERHTRATILIEVGRSTEALSVLGTDDPVSAAPVDAEAVRLTVLAWVLERQPQTALDVSARARSSITLDDAGVAWAEAVAHFSAALANGVVPDLGAFPNPVDRSLFRQDAASLGHLDEAARRFSELAGSVDASERGDLEVWHLAAISSDPTRGEQAEMLSRCLLSRAKSPSRRRGLGARTRVRGQLRQDPSLVPRSRCSGPRDGFPPRGARWSRGVARPTGPG